MNFYELHLIVENQASDTLQDIINHPNVYIEKDKRFYGEEATWKYLNSQLDIEIVIYKDYLEGSYKNLTPQEFYKNFFHPDLGVIPHELLEGRLTGLIMRQRFEEIPIRFKKSFDNHRKYFDKLFEKHNFDENSIHKNEQAYDEFGGYVHEVIVNTIPEYDAWGNYTYKKIFKIGIK